MAAPKRRKRQKVVHHFPFIITWLKINLTTKTERDFYTGGMPDKRQKIAASHSPTVLPQLRGPSRASGLFDSSARARACARSVVRAKSTAHPRNRRNQKKKNFFFKPRLTFVHYLPERELNFFVPIYSFSLPLFLLGIKQLNQNFPFLSNVSLKCEDVWKVSIKGFFVLFTFVLINWFL